MIIKLCGKVGRRQKESGQMSKAFLKNQEVEPDIPTMRKYAKILDLDVGKRPRRDTLVKALQEHFDNVKDEVENEDELLLCEKCGQFTDDNPAINECPFCGDEGEENEDFFNDDTVISIVEDDQDEESDESDDEEDDIELDEDDNSIQEPMKVDLDKDIFEYIPEPVEEEIQDDWGHSENSNTIEIEPEVEQGPFQMFQGADYSSSGDKAIVTIVRNGKIVDIKTIEL